MSCCIMGSAFFIYFFYSSFIYPVFFSYLECWNFMSQLSLQQFKPPCSNLVDIYVMSWCTGYDWEWWSWLLFFLLLVFCNYLLNCLGGFSIYCSFYNDCVLLKTCSGALVRLTDRSICSCSSPNLPCSSIEQRAHQICKRICKNTFIIWRQCFSVDNVVS